MNMQLNLDEVQVAVIEYLRKRGVIVADVSQVRLQIINRQGERLDIAGCAAVVAVNNVKLPEEGGPYR